MHLLNTWAASSAESSGSIKTLFSWYKTWIQLQSATNVSICLYLHLLSIFQLSMPFLNLTSYHSSPFSPLFSSPFVHFPFSSVLSGSSQGVLGCNPSQERSCSRWAWHFCWIIDWSITSHTTPTIHSSTQLGKPKKTHTIHLIYMTILFFCSTLIPYTSPQRLFAFKSVSLLQKSNVIKLLQAERLRRANGRLMEDESFMFSQRISGFQ